MLVTKEPLNIAWRRPLKDAVQGKVQFDVPMGQHTTFGVGGPADAWVEPLDPRDLAHVLAFAAEKGVRCTVIGQGTNVLVKDSGIRGIVVRLAAQAFRTVRVEAERVTAGAGVSNTRLLESLKQAGLSGMEFACGIPGCVGGGVAMNAGAHGSCFADMVTEVSVMDRTGAARSMSGNSLDFVYRGARNLGDGIVLSATLELAQASQEKIRSRIAELLDIRNATQPKGSSPGCVFKNPQGKSAGKIIDALGLKGTRVGGARVSALHGNFILNDRTASAAEIIELIEKVRAEVFARAGIALETEVKVLG